MSFCSFFQNKDYTETAQLISAFAIGVVFSSFSWGGIWFILYVIVYEILMGACNKWQGPFWTLLGRTGVIYASIFGFLSGRSLIGFDPFLREPDPVPFVVIDRRKIRLVKN